MARRIGLLVVAIVVALLGAASLLSYANHAKASAAEGKPTLRALVARSDIAAGTAGEAVGDKAALQTLPASIVPSGALIDLKALAGQVAAREVHVGEVLLPTSFVAKQIAGSIQIPPGKMAMSVQVQDPARVGGFVLPGSKVAVFDTFLARPATPESTRLLLGSVQVIAVGPTALSTVGGASAVPKADKSGGLGSGGGGDPTALLTVAVDADQALKLVHAAQTGRLYFTLLSDTSRPGDGARSVDNTTLFN